MTCEIENGLNHQDQEVSGLFSNGCKTIKVGSTQVDILAGGQDQPTKIYVMGGHLDYSTTGKVKERPVSVGLGISLYGNGATASFLSPEDPNNFQVTNRPHFAVINLQKEKVSVL